MEYSKEEFDAKKTQVLKYILYKKRTESEVRTKFCNSIDENMLEDIIEYLKNAGYINDEEYIEKLVREYMNLKHMSIREIKNKVYSKGIYADLIENYISNNREVLEEYELKSAKRLAEKKGEKEPEKLQRYLINKGFDSDVVQKILKGEE
ncbi:MAG: RecX family transcriptional regulator [Clostridia bacterium]|jgi:SOS response regulatory protein OraA/RecX|nr:RecX family transcriptional regulator [Clostridia bacterium]MCI9274750.1 RecX family transcriptional regulator [Clostridia bacterium]